MQHPEVGKRYPLAEGFPMPEGAEFDYNAKTRERAIAGAAVLAEVLAQHCEAVEGIEAFCAADGPGGATKLERVLFGDASVGVLPLGEESEDSPRPRRYLVEAGRRWPRAWREVDKVRSRRGKEIPDWPEWCFMLPEHAYEIAGCKGNGVSGPQQFEEAVAFNTLAAWRVTQGIYRFDPDVLEEVWRTPANGSLPAEALLRLPEWCVYVETPGRAVLGREIHGFFAHLSWDSIKRRAELHFVLDSKEGLSPCGFGLAGDVRSGIEALADEIGSASLSELAGEHAGELAGRLYPLVSTVLYLCSVTADIEGRGSGERRPSKPHPKKTKKGPRLFAPDQPTVWETGYRTGAVLRSSRSRISAERSGAHASPRPHFRRAHWHSYWTGPRDRPEERELKVKWQWSTLVNASGPESLVPTIRPVES